VISLKNLNKCNFSWSSVTD